MLSYIEGLLTHKEPAFVIIDVQGVGYEINTSLSTFSKIKGSDKVKLYVHLSIKEDAHTLYGFFDMAEKRTFLDLISISGVGPGTGLTILSSLSFQELQQAVLNEDLKTIQGIKGIGIKTAQRIILELKDKFKKDSLISQSHNITITSHNAIRSDALAALLSLGIAKAVAEKSLDNILKTNDAITTTEELIKIALKSA